MDSERATPEPAVPLGQSHFAHVEQTIVGEPVGQRISKHVSPRAVVGRNLATGDCCQYPSGCEVPETMALFSSEEACRTDCRCADVDQIVTPENTMELGAERISLECNCPNGNCPAHLEAPTRGRCEGVLAEYVTRVEGCGMIALQTFTGYGSSSLVFDADSVMLIGISSRGDTPSEPAGPLSPSPGANSIATKRRRAGSAPRRRPRRYAIARRAERNAEQRAIAQAESALSGNRCGSLGAAARSGPCGNSPSHRSCCPSVRPAVARRPRPPLPPRRPPRGSRPAAAVRSPRPPQPRR
jgi:hypothetical protein